MDARTIEAVENIEDKHEVEFRLQLVIDGEVIAEVSDYDEDVATSQISVDYLKEKKDEYMLEEVVSSEEDYLETERI